MWHFLLETLVPSRLIGNDDSFRHLLKLIRRNIDNQAIALGSRVRLLIWGLASHSLHIGE
jgi:hypothetical protein